MRWLASARFDLAFILGPPLAAVLLVLAVPALRSPALPAWGWLVFIVFVDVAHVWSSLYRTYLDPGEFARRRALYVGVPLACWAAGALLYSVEDLLFWRVLAYVAVFHFVRQQFGFVMLYRHRARERDDAALDKAAIYASMLYPLAFWHADGGRVFSWFMAGDFVPLPRSAASLGFWLYTAVIAAFALRQVQHLARGRGVNWPKVGVVASTAAVWYVGIVLLNSDFAFTVTNVVAHGVPYVALIWLYGRRKWAGDRGWRGLVHRPAWVGLFAGLIFAIAFVEEGVWDVLVWKEHAAIFGGVALPFALPDAALAVVVPLLTVPQAAHYILDAWIWKFDGSNPGLKEHLLGAAAAAPAPAPAIGESLEDPFPAVRAPATGFSTASTGTSASRCPPTP